jgi:hypothetical protein
MRMANLLVFSFSYWSYDQQVWLLCNHYDSLRIFQGCFTVQLSMIALFLCASEALLFSAFLGASSILTPHHPEVN